MLKIFFQMLQMLFFDAKKYDDIVNKNSGKLAHIFQKKISLTLHINEWIFKIHNCYVELFLLFMKYNNLFVAVFQFDFLLIEIFHCVYNKNVFAICNDCSDVDLNWHKINIADYYFVQFFYVYHDIFFYWLIFRFWSWFFKSQKRNNRMKWNFWFISFFLLM